MRAAITFFFAFLVSLPAVAQDIALKTRLAVDGQGNVLRDAIIIVRGGRIISIQERGPIPQDAQAVDLTKFTVMPGMIDMHVHITAYFGRTALFGSSQERPSVTAFWAADNARKFLDSGFTTLRSLDASNFVDVDLRDAIAAGRIPGPRLLVSGAGLGESAVVAADGDLITRMKDPPKDLVTPMRAFVRTQLAGNVDVIKIYGSKSIRVGGGPTYSLEQMTAAIDEAHRAGKKVAVHAHASEAVRRAIEAGADTIEHGALMDDAAIDLLVAKHIAYVPNFYNFDYYLANSDKFGFTAEDLRYTREAMKPRADAFVRAMNKGALILFGTDAVAGMAGHTATEFERRVALGMSNKQAIAHATGMPAQVLRMADKIGDLKPGMFADIIAVEGNPLEDVKALGRVTFVMKDGKIYKRR